MHKRTALLPALALFALCLFASGARADAVVLTGGTATNSGLDGSVRLFGNDFVVQYTGDANPSFRMTVPFNTATAGFGHVTFNGITSGIFSGGVTFNDTMLTGTVTAYATMDDMFFRVNPLFIVNFSGPGFVTLTTLSTGVTQRQFTVATPEPLTLLLFGTGLAGVAAVRRRRREPAHRDEPDQSQ